MIAALDDPGDRLRAAAVQPVAIDPFMTHVGADSIYRSLFSATPGASGAPRIQDAFARYQRHAKSAFMPRLYRLPAFGTQRRASAAARIRRGFAPIVEARYAAMARLLLTGNVFRGALRRYPPLGVLLLEANCPVSIWGRPNATESMPVVTPWPLQRNANHRADPRAFGPDGYDDSAGKTAMRDAWLSCGRAPRVCIGAGFAQREAPLVLDATEGAFRLSAVPGDKPEPVGRRTLRARPAVRLYLRPRA